MSSMGIAKRFPVKIIGWQKLIYNAITWLNTSHIHLTHDLTILFLPKSGIPNLTPVG
jgi:hypothetical protein